MSLDFTEYDKQVAKFRSGSPNIAAAFDENKKLLKQLDGETTPEPQPPGTLKWKPPGYPSYTGYTQMTTGSGPQKVDLDNTKDYVLKVGTKQWSSGGGRTIGLHINGGRNVVVIGGAFTFTSTSNQDDATAVMVDGGDPAGVVHLEGLNIDCANGITVRSKRTVQIENCRIRVRTYKDDHDGGAGIHPDLVQVWGTGIQPAAIRMHKFTGLTRYTGLSCLESDPLVWERYECEIRPDKNDNGTMDTSNYAYMCNGATGAQGGPYCEYKGEVYAELGTGGNGQYPKKIDDLVCLRSLVGGLKVFPYEIRDPAGTAVYTSPAEPTGGNSPMAVGTKVGNYLTYSRVPKFAGHKWIIGKPAQEFVPSSVVGPNYVSPGYL